MLRYIAIAAIAAGCVVSVPSISRAECQWQWDCSSGAGQCKQVPICDSTMDLPPLPPLELPPIPPPSVPPIEQPTIPPIGTRQCAPRQMCDTDGHCEWREICSP